MNLYVISYSDGSVHLVRKYIRSDLDNIEYFVWCDDWYGRHKIGFDCDFYKVETKID